MIIVGNLKMNLSLDEIISYQKKLINSGIIICPSFPYLNLFKQEGYDVCAQNISEYNNGPYTGEVSASQIKSLNVNYVLIGHSERRHVFKESQETINNKIQRALENDLQIVYCIGETYEEKEQSKTKEVLENQIVSVFNNLTIEQMNRIIIGYEPVWAISDGVHPAETPTNQEINEINLYIKELIKKSFNFSIKVLYGGSVNLNNIEELYQVKSHDGFLIGGASKNVDDLLKINDKCKQ